MHNGSASDFGSESIGSIPVSPARLKNMEEKKLIELYKPRMEETISLVESILDSLQKYGYNNAVKYPNLYQEILNWLDELNLLSVVL